MTSALNSTIEISTRALLVLYNSSAKARTMSDIAAIDYLASYSKSFGVGENNLNGDGEFNFVEFANRLHAMEKACAFLVRRGLVDALMGVDGFTFTINNAGKAFCNQLTNEYASDFQEALDKVFTFEVSHSGIDLTTYINEQGATLPGEEMA